MSSRKNRDRQNGFQFGIQFQQRISSSTVFMHKNVHNRRTDWCVCVFRKKNGKTQRPYTMNIMTIGCMLGTVHYTQQKRAETLTRTHTSQISHNANDRTYFWAHLILHSHNYTYSFRMCAVGDVCCLWNFELRKSIYIPFHPIRLA